MLICSFAFCIHRNNTDSPLPSRREPQINFQRRVKAAMLKMHGILIGLTDKKYYCDKLKRKRKAFCFLCTKIKIEGWVTWLQTRRFRPSDGCRSESGQVRSCSSMILAQRNRTATLLGGRTCNISDCGAHLQAQLVLLLTLTSTLARTSTM